MNSKEVYDYTIVVLMVVLIGYILHTSDEAIDRSAEIHKEVESIRDDVNSLRLVIERTELFNTSNIDETTMGIYDPKSKAYLVVTDRDQFGVYKTSVHEYAHYIYYEILNESQRQEWIAIHNSSENYISPYAQTNAQEDFAETFAWSVQLAPNDEILYGLEPLKRSFLQNHVLSDLWEEGVVQ